MKSRGLIRAIEEPWPESDRKRCTVHRWRSVAGKLPKNDTQLHERVEAAYWAALDEAVSRTDGEARLRGLITDLERSYPSAAACLAEDLPALCVHLGSLEEVKRRTKVIGRLPGETSRLSLWWAVLDLFIAGAGGPGITAFEHRQLAQMRAATTTRTPNSLTA